MTVEFKFCPKCGGSLEEEEWEENLTLPVCSGCGYKFYQNSKPCVVGIIIDRDAEKILLTKRGIIPFKGDWDMPGGFLRNGEDPKQGVLREVKEELGIECEVEELFDIFVDTYGEYDIYTFNVCYILKIISGTITPMDDVAEAQWFSLSDIPENLAFTFLKDIIDKARTYLCREM
jgi:mutator protein MutT